MTYSYTEITCATWRNSNILQINCHFLFFQSRTYLSMQSSRDFIKKYENSDNPYIYGTVFYLFIVPFHFWQLPEFWELEKFEQNSFPPFLTSTVSFACSLDLSFPMWILLNNHSSQLCWFPPFSEWLAWL